LTDGELRASPVSVTAADTVTVDGAVTVTGTTTSQTQGYNGTNWQNVRIDLSTRSFQTIDYAHHEIHAGSYYVVGHAAGSKGDGDKINIYLKTPDTASWVHMFVRWSASGAAYMRVLEGPTVTANTGTTQLVYNRNRNSNNTTTVWNNATTPVQGSVMKDATVTNNGTMVYEEFSGAARTFGAASRNSEEIILKQNTVYIFEVESDAAGLVLDIDLDYYHHTDQAA
jgi:hypothetical protein